MDNIEFLLTDDRKMKLVCKQLSDLEEIASKIINFAGDYRIWLLEGEMGAGKTTFTKVICKQLGVAAMVNSPTFSIVNEYSAAKGEILYHFDFYRIKNEVEALDIGCEEYFDSGCYCFIEWSSRISSLIPSKYLKIEIGIGGMSEGSHERVINVSKHE